MGFRVVKTFFDLGRLSKVKGQGQNPKLLKSNISKTVRDRKKCQQKLDRKSCMGFRMLKIFLIPDDLLRSKVKVKSQKTLKSNI